MSVTKKETPVFQNILSIFIHVKDLERSKRWYSNVLGINFGGVDGNRTNELGVGLVLLQSEKFTPCSESLFVIQTPHLRETHRKFKELKVEVGEIVEEISCFNFKDLDGNVMTIWQ